jgi:hypothetical protein
MINSQCCCVVALVQAGGSISTGVAIPAPFAYPVGIVLLNGVSYVSDYNDNTVYTLTDSATKTSYCTGLNGPVGMAFDSQGRLVVGEASWRLPSRHHASRVNPSHVQRTTSATPWLAALPAAAWPAC